MYREKVIAVFDVRDKNNVKLVALIRVEIHDITLFVNNRKRMKVYLATKDKLELSMFSKYVAYVGKKYHSEKDIIQNIRMYYLSRNIERGIIIIKDFKLATKNTTNEAVLNKHIKEKYNMEMRKIYANHRW